MKKKQKLQKLIDLICEEEQQNHDYYDEHKCGCPTDTLGIIEGMCSEHAESEWCNSHCEMYYNTPKKNYEKCIRHWYLGEDT